jgi:hypothetical protein
VLKKRKPAYTTALATYNGLCNELQKLYKPEYPIPPPLPLSSNIQQTKDDSALAQDIWVGTLSEPTPRWTSDPQIRKGIRGLLLLDRCKEEMARIDLETRNLLNWYEKSIGALEVARRIVDGMTYYIR